VTQFGGRRNSLLEELHMEANIDLAELVTGAYCDLVQLIIIKQAQ
jgi:hypothetical protein